MSKLTKKEMKCFKGMEAWIDWKEDADDLEIVLTTVDIRRLLDIIKRISGGRK